MDLYSYKYKDRKPEETVDILKKFFNNRDLKIVETTQESEIETWSTQLEAFLNDQIVYFSNGKGMTKILSQASAYAELYERFCNHFEYLINPYFFKQIIKRKKDYYFHPKEKIMSIEEGIAKIKTNSSQDFFYSTLIPDNNLLKNYLSFILNDKYIEIPFKSVDEKQEKYFDIRIMQKMSGSTGMAAGNNLNEALVQGLSEIFERTASRLYYDNYNAKYYELDIDNMSQYIPITLFQKIQKIKNNINYKIKFFDLSYNFSMPVILGVLIDIKNSRIIPDFGSAPTFEIALERVITELYQGVKSYSTLNNVHDSFNRAQMPFNNKKYYDIVLLFNKSNYANSPVFNEKILLDKNIVKIATPSNVWYNNKKISNTLLKKHYLNLLKKLNMQCYYYDVSLDNNMSAVYIFNNSFNFLSTELNGIKQLNIDFKKVLESHDICKKWLENIFRKEYIEINLKYLDQYECAYYDLLFSFTDILTIDFKNRPLIKFYANKMNDLLNASTEQDLIKVLYQINDHFHIFSPLAKKYIMILNYLKVYPKEEVYKLLNSIGFNVSENDISNIYNTKYLYEKIFVETLFDLYNNQFCQKLIKIFQR